MYVIREDAEILTSEEVIKMKKEYEKRFGERFITFNYDDFQSTKEKTAGQLYKEALETALREGKPYHIESKAYVFYGH